MKEIKISFLIAAHNEEKIIGKTLENLLRLPYSNFEVIIGLDGCTDNTEKIVKNYCEKSCWLHIRGIVANCEDCFAGQFFGCH